MKCSDLPIIEIVRGELSSLQRDAALEHLQECRPCRERLAILFQLQTLYGSSAEVSLPLRPKRTVLRRIWLPCAATVLLGLLLVPAWYKFSPSIPSGTPPEPGTPFPIQILSSLQDTQDREDAARAFRAGDFETAAQLFASLPPSTENLFFQGLSLLHGKRYEEAVAVLTDCLVDGGPWRERALWFRAEALLASGRHAEAITDLRRVVSEKGTLEAEARRRLREEFQQ